MEYRRHYQPGGWYFFTVVTYQRQPILTQPGNITCLRRAFGRVRKKTSILDRSNNHIT